MLHVSRKLFIDGWRLAHCTLGAHCRARVRPTLGNWTDGRIHVGTRRADDIFACY